MTHLTWLHLSDLHYGNPKDSWYVQDIRDKLLDDLRNLEKEKN